MVVKGSRFGVEGWQLFGLTAALIIAMSGVLLAFQPRLVDGTSSVVSATARTSATLFLMAFTGSAAAILFCDAPMARWLRRNRRYLGLLFAFSHFVHAIAIVAYAQLAPEQFWSSRNLANNTIGTIGYFFIAIMAFTSFDTTARLVGPRLWRLIHSVGIWVIWVDFVLAFGSRIPKSLWYILPVVLLFAALGVRLMGSRKCRAAMVPT
jgi:methionine sulfoxide reductase heme-binding subunit